MMSNTVLKVTINEDKQIEVYVDMNSVDPLSLVGVLEQIKLDIFKDHMPIVKETIIDAKRYDA
jgi:hypothetical protein